MKEKLLRRPKPFEYEKLSHYLKRVVKKNACILDDISRGLDFSCSLKRVFLDYSIPDSDIALLSILTDSSFKTIKDLTYKRFYFEKKKKNI